MYFSCEIKCQCTINILPSIYSYGIECINFKVLPSPLKIKFNFNNLIVCLCINSL